MSVSVDSVMVTAGDGRQLQVLTTTGTDTPTVVLDEGREEERAGRHSVRTGRAGARSRMATSRS